MRKLFETDRRYLPLGLVGALFIALALVLGALIWANQANAERGVVLIHVQKDGTDYKGNPECPGNGQPVNALGQASTIAAAERAIDDCNNLIGTTHLIRTEGFLGATMVPSPAAAPWAIMVGRPGQILLGNPAMTCGDAAFAPYRGPGWSSSNDAELCVLITSSEPGETSITFGYTYTPTQIPPPTQTTVTPSPTPTPPLAGFNLAGPIVKEWNKLDHTEIWQLSCTNPADPATCTAADLVGAGDTTGETLVETSMVDMEFDTAADRLRGMKRLREIVWGWHLDPDAPDGAIVVPVEGARVTVFIDNNEDGVPDTFPSQTCAFFTGFNVVVDPFDTNDLADKGTVLTGVTRTHVDGSTITTHAIFDDPDIPGDDLLLHDIYVDTTCKETTTIRIKVEYPAGIFSIPGVIWEKTKILWQEKEVGKQPQIRWAGEKIVLAKRWALPQDIYYPNRIVGISEKGAQCTNAIDDDNDTLVNDGCPTVGTTAESGNMCLDSLDGLLGTAEETPADDVVNDGCPTNVGGFAPVCPHAGKIVQYNKESGNGGLTTGLPDLLGPLSNEPTMVSTIVDAECISRAMYESEEQGEENIKVILHDFTSPPDIELAFQSASNDCINRYNLSTKTAADLTALNTCLATAETSYLGDLAEDIRFPGFLTSEEKQDAFLVWYLKIYQVKLDNVLLGEDGTGRADHNAGVWGGEDPITSDGADAETLNVSQDALVRVTVKGWFYSGNNSGRSDVCVDIDGDGDGVDDDGDTLLNEDPDDDVDNDGDTEVDEDTQVAGQPYKTTTHEGCKDTDDEALDHGYWVLPDDMAKLAGPNWQVTKANWDVMSDADEASSVSGGAFVGPKSSLDSHDDIARPWVPHVGTTLRKTVDPDGELTAADAIMPPLKLTAMIDDPADAGFLKQADKDDDVGIESLYQSIMLGADPEIPQLGETGGGTYGYEINSWIQGPYEFFRIFLSALSLVADCPDLDGELCNANIGNQIDQDPWDENHPRLIQLYSDNRGLAYFFANGDYNLSFDECPLQQYSGTPFCSPGDVVGVSDITVTGDYPYFRKHSSVESNLVEKTWTWGGFKSVTAVTIDATHTAIIAHLKDRDGYCKWEVGSDPTDDGAVVFSPSEHEVQHEWIEFLLNDAVGYIREVSPNSLYDGDVLDDHSIIDIGMPISEIVKIQDHVHVPLAEEASTGLEDGFVSQAERAAAARAEDIRVLAFYGEARAADADFVDPSDPDECQAWIVIQHPADEDPNVSVVFHDPEGRIDLHWPTSQFVSILNQGWNDSCYTGPEMDIEEALTDAGLIESDGTPHVLAVYRLINDGSATFDRWFPDAAADVNTITTIAPYDQLFLLLDSPLSWAMDVVADPVGQKDTQVSLTKDWNSVCYAGVDKAPEEAAASINNSLVIMYTLATDQTWRRYVPNRDELTNIVTLNQYTSVFTLMTNAGIWVFDP